MAGKSGGGSTTTVQKADPWIGVQPYLAGNETIPGLFNEATEWYNNAANRTYYPGQTVANPSGSTLDAEALTRQRALSGGLSAGQMADANVYAHLLSNLTDQYSNDVQGRSNALNSQYQGVLNGSDPTAAYLSSIMGGSMLGSNPYLSAAMDAANSNTTRQFKNAVMPGLASQFSAGGRYGSGAQIAGISDATNNLATQISNTNANIANADYQFERGMQGNAAQQLANLRMGALSGIGQNNQATASLLSGRQLAGMNMLPQLAMQGQNMDYQNLAALAGVGAQQDARQQALINADIARYNYNRDAPLEALKNWGNILMGGAGLGSSSSSTQSTGQTGSGLSNALGGGMLGYAGGQALGGLLAGSTLGSGLAASTLALGGPIGLGVGALAGLLL